MHKKSLIDDDFIFYIKSKNISHDRIKPEINDHELLFSRDLNRLTAITQLKKNKITGIELE